MVQALPIRNIIGNVKKSMTIYYSYLFSAWWEYNITIFSMKVFKYVQWKIQIYFQHGGLLWFRHLSSNTCNRPEAGSGTIFIWSRVRYNIYPGTAVQYVQHGRLCSRYIYIHQVQLQRNSTSLNSDRLTHLLTCLPYLFCQFCNFWC